MEMTTERTIEIFNEHDRISGLLLYGNSEDDSLFNSETIEAMNNINAILYKYQKIEEIIKSKKMDALNIGLLIPKDMACVLHEIKEVVEDDKERND